MSAESPKKAGPRLQHVAAHINENYTRTAPMFDEIFVFGQEIDALRHTHGKTGWVYAAVAHGQSFTDQLKAART